MAQLVKSPHRLLMERLVELWGEVRAGEYFVRRGPIHWPTHNWQARPRAVAIMMSASSLFGFLQQRPEDGVLTFEVLVPLDESAEPDADDAVIEQMREDAIDVLMRLATEPAPGLSLSIGEREARAQETVDHALGVQGIVVSLDVKFGRGDG